MFANGKNMSSSVNRLWSLNRIPVMGSNEVESPNTGVAITYIYCCMSFLIAYNARVWRVLMRYTLL